MLFKTLFSKKWLLTTNIVSSGALLALGDGLQQAVERKRGVAVKHDWGRSGRMLIMGLTMGPPHHYWYVWLDRYLKPSQVWTKILADQIVAAPLFAFGFFYGMGYLEGKNSEECATEFKKKFLAVYAFDWLFWPPSQYINFNYVPTKFRVLYVNGVTIVWDGFLSYMKHYDQVRPKADELD